MAQTPAVKTLLALVVCMTLGTFALVLMQTEPIRSPLMQLASVTTGPTSLAQLVRRTESDIPQQQWKNIIVYRDGRSMARAPQRFHFIVRVQGDEPTVEATGLWREQASAQHPLTDGGPDWNADSIGIYVMPHYGQVGPEQIQMSRQLCSELQKLLHIGADHVYPSETVPGLRD